MSARWSFTVNNPGDYRPAFNAGSMAYLVFQLERGAEGTPHLQGYVRFTARKRMSTVKRELGNEGAHVEIAEGTEEHNRNYCTKLESRIEPPSEFGVYESSAGKQGKRSDLEHVADMVAQGAPMKEIALAHPGDFIRYHHGIKAYRLAVQDKPPNQRNVEVIVLWGSTGTGKTHRVLTTWPDCYSVEPGRDPWSGYVTQETIFFDEFDWHLWPIDKMKKILDKWPFELDRRYQNAFAAWTRVVICCNQNPATW